MSTVTILALAEHRLGREASTGQDFADANLAILGGCEVCATSIAAYNAYPAKTGYWRCGDCIGDFGWDTVEQANADIFDGPEPDGYRSDGDHVIPTTQ